MADPFARAGALHEAYDAVDWAATPVGPVDSWTPALRNAVEIMLGTRFAVTLLWGPEYVLLYNEAYVDLIADKHPAALGQPASAVFPEIWDVIGPMLDSVHTTGEATWVEDTYLPLVRSGYLEECYFTFSYSPVTAPDGSIEGVLDVSVETTKQVLAERRLRLLAELGTALAETEDLAELDRVARKLLLTSDLPRVRLWLPDVGPSERPDRSADLSRDLSLTGEGAVAWLPLPVSQPRLVGSLLAVDLNPERALDDDYRAFLLLVGGLLARAADRIVATTAERSLSAALQRSVLSEPVHSPGLEIAVRYQPAVKLAQIGGDWYDAFRLPSGTIAVAVGDVAGHDQDAAATMAQLRNLARGVAHAGASSPAQILSAVDNALEGLELGAVATALLVEVDDVRRTARWSNAGHLPAVLVEPDGAARLLEARPDPLLGLAPDLERDDHEVVLAPGATLVLYTDGLVERRGVALQSSLDWLVDAVAGTHDHSPEELCDQLLELTSGTVEDDVALLVMRVR